MLKDSRNSNPSRLNSTYQTFVKNTTTTVVNSTTHFRNTTVAQPTSSNNTVLPTLYSTTITVRNTTLNATEVVFNSTAPVPSSEEEHDRLVIGLSIVAGILTVVFLLCVVVRTCRWCKRRMELQRDLTPYYSYDQSEADVQEGVLFTGETNSGDMMCVVADQLGSSDNSDNDISFANTNYFSSSLSDRLLKERTEMGDFSSLSV